MKRSGKFRIASALLTNLLTAVFVLWAIIMMLTYPGPKTMSSGYGVYCFKYFTVDSNVLCALSSLAWLTFGIRALCTGKEVPRAVSVLRLAGTAAVTITFLGVMIVLGPPQGYRYCFRRENLFMHLLVPVISILSFTALERPKDLGFLSTLPSCILPAVYMVFYVYLLSRHRITDFYGLKAYGLPMFLMVPVFALFGILCAGLLLSGSKIGQKKHPGKKMLHK